MEPKDVSSSNLACPRRTEQLKTGGYKLLFNVLRSLEKIFPRLSVTVTRCGDFSHYEKFISILKSSQLLFLLSLNQYSLASLFYVPTLFLLHTMHFVRFKVSPALMQHCETHCNHRCEVCVRRSFQLAGLLNVSKKDRAGGRSL